MGTLKYTMVKSPLLRGGVFAKIKSVGVADLDTLAGHIAGARNSHFGRETVKAVVAELRAAILFYLTQGTRVNVSTLLELYPSYQRRFERLTDKIGRDKTGLQVSCRVSRQFMRDFRRRSTLRRDERPDGIWPVAAEYDDMGSHTRDAVVTPGAIGTVRGEHLKANLTNPDEGVVFVARSTDVETQVRELSRNTPKELTFLVPPLVPGEVYRLEVRVRPRNVKALRDCKLENALTCAAR